jgi:hypothetical protein
MKPSIGRIVIFQNKQKLQLPAIVVAVETDGSVELHVFGMNPAKAKSTEGIEPGQWQWPVREPEKPKLKEQEIK